MVKKKVGGGKRYKAVASAKAQGLAEPKWDGPAPPLHIQKKLARKVQFLDKVSTNASTLRTSKSGVNKKTGRKKALPDLSTLGEVLDEVSKKGGASKSTAGGKQGKERGTSVNTAKQRHHILVEESQPYAATGTGTQTGSH
ncbi:hypothetical protein HYH02_014800 [Chlamydomonas schloesseri]|uniref:Uncharacterized protein n=1 Tax=Chlamydomonas schloesseri TaxID=2026947 RepID=A0A835VRC7_9CHLO|nr:hypothetical protein HYH02_014800 [Chlamydomonas schloesseri]|eukprot:KAG2426372.1 hypothetical protein HYH02_014800 [Chlamydomonas schloesseri]